MKGIIIYENDLGSINAVKLKHASFCCKSIEMDITDTLEGTPIKCESANCNKDDTYDFETGALIALMKMCGVDKIVRACNEAFSEDTFKIYAIKYERELNELKKDFDKVRDLKDFYKKNYEDVKEHYGKLGDRNKYLMEDINKKLGYLKEKDEEIKRLEASNCAKGILNGKLLKDYNTAQNAYEVMVEKSANLMDKVKKLEEENEKLKSDKDKSWKNYQRNIQKKQDRINELEKAVSDAADTLTELNDKYDKAMDGLKKAKELDEYREKHIKELEEENEKLKLDCEKLQHGYNDMIFCGGRQNGKQYTFLVDLFKKLDQKKVDAAYKEAYDKWIAQPIWQKEVFKQIHKDQLASLLEAGKYLYKIPTKREEMWEKIFTLHKEGDVIIKVKKEDIITFLHEIENKIPEITWASCVKIFETKYTIKDIFKELEGCDTPYEICFRLWKVNKLSYSSDQYIYPSYEFKHIDYLPPMRWDLFEKGRLAVKVTYDTFKEFYDACEKELGKRPLTMFPCTYTVSICKDDGFFEIFTVEDQKKTGRKIVDWDDVR